MSDWHQEPPPEWSSSRVAAVLRLLRRGPAGGVAITFPPGAADYMRVWGRLAEAPTVAALDALRPEIDALPAWRQDLVRTYFRLREQRRGL